MNIRHICYISALLLTLNSCGGGGNDGSGDNEPSPTYSLTLTFERINSGPLNPFTVTASLLSNDQNVTSAAIDFSLTLSQGSASDITESSPGNYQFTVTPNQTGEHQVTVSYLDKASVTRTALVIDTVHSDWGQPMAVEGLVNTEGYEDGITITPDGEYLFVQYGPMYFSALQLFNTPRAQGGCEGHRLEFPLGTPNRCTHTWLDNTIGPYSGPERPGFFDGRFSETTNLHNARSWGVLVEQAPNFAPSTLLYGFKRQADNSFAEPFYIAFDDENDAIINTSGLSFLMHDDGTATILFSIDDPSDSDMVDLDNNSSDDIQSFHDIFTDTITLGQNNILGTFTATGTPGTPPERGTPFSAQLVNFGKTGTEGIAGTQGNPHLHAIEGSVQSIWTDDERDTDADKGELAVYFLTSGNFPDGNWQKVLLPSAVNQAAPSDEIQPFFTGNGLYYTHMSDIELPEVYYSNYSGTHSINDIQNNNNWGSREKILGIGSTNTIGSITALGEPTIATINNEEYLYFVYGYVRDFDNDSGLPDINMQAGYVKKN